MMELPDSQRNVILSVDPGDKHVGMAWWTWFGYKTRIEFDEVGPKECIEWVRTLLPRLGYLIIEDFILYPWEAQKQSGSGMETSQLIGRLKQLAEDAGIEPIMQGANIKKPTARQAVGRKWKRRARGKHARDAELHLLHFIWKRNLGQFVDGS